MFKTETIVKHKSGYPNQEKKLITWIEFVADIRPESEGEMNKMAIDLLNGNFLYSSDGYTYFLNGINARDNEPKN